MRVSSKANQNSNQSRDLTSLIDGSAFDDRWRDDSTIENGAREHMRNGAAGEDVPRADDDHAEEERNTPANLSDSDPRGDGRHSDAPQGTDTGQFVRGHVINVATAPQTFLIEGTVFDDTLNGTMDDDTMQGGFGDDTLNGGFGNDFLYGNEDDDTLNGGPGNDLLDGGSGNDVLAGGLGADTLIGGAGIDTVSYRGANRGVMLDLQYGGVTNDASGDTYSGIENVDGSNFGDIIQGDAQDNRIEGFDGDDFLFGGGGNDRIVGGEGWDVLRGGAGDDILIGDGGDDRLTGDDDGSFGRDTFVIQGFSGVDVITDFQRGTDRLNLSWNFIVDFGADGELAIGSVHDGFDNLDSDDQFAYDVETHTLYWIWHVNTDVGGERNLYTPLAILQGVDTLSADDIV